MSSEISINTDIITWAITRAGYDLEEFISRIPKVQNWIDGTKKPTVKQLEDFSKKVHLPFGYLFLSTPPKEKLPIPYFRTNNKQITNISLNIYDTILLIQQRQDWLRNYLLDNEFKPLPFVGKFANNFNVEEIVGDIRETLTLEENWASKFKTWYEALDFLTHQIEDKGIIILFNSIVGNNAHRKIPIDECRGFVLVDRIAPFMFINNADAKSAQMFTIVHELAHIWTGNSAGFDFRKLQPAEDPIEILCNKVAAEFLVPEKEFNSIWNNINNTKSNIKSTARHFKVSEVVIARRALDTGKITKKQYFNFYNGYLNQEFLKKEKRAPGGDYYATTKKRLSITFAAHINNAVKSGNLLYRDAYKLTGLKGDTFQMFFSKYF